MAGETVLIVEDHRENIVHLANNVLRPSGYEVLTAMDGRRGLHRILADKPDLVILDLNMPRMDGLEVLAALQEHQVDIPVILTTFYGSEQVAEQARRLGAVDYVVKPYKVSDMLNAVEKALAHRPTKPAPDKPERPQEPDETIPLTRQVERWMRDMNILTRVGKALVAQLDVRRVCKRTVEAALYIIRANHAFLILLNEGDETKLCLCATRGPDDRDVRLIEEPVESPLALQVAKSGQTRVLADAQEETSLAQMVGHPLGPLAAAPLRWQQQTLGVLLATRAPGAPGFGEADMEWLAGLADYAAVAVRNARLFQQQRPLATPPHDIEQKLHDVERELERLGAELQAITDGVQRLAMQVAQESRSQAGCQPEV
ncbi:MAG TPA: response regulator [Anaerolineae bacterium]|nr:response regulator [Anaerolineae bacterium]